MDIKLIGKLAKVTAKYHDFFSGRSSRRLGSLLVELVNIIKEQGRDTQSALSDAVEIVNETWLLDWSKCEEAYSKAKRYQTIQHAVEMGSSESPDGTW